MRPDLSLDESGALLSTWADDPWAGAAYSTSPAPGLADLLARATGPLAFAGGSRTQRDYGGSVRRSGLADPDAGQGPRARGGVQRRRDAVAITLLVLNVESPR